MKTPTVEQIIYAMKQKGYVVFDTLGGHNLNIVGIRTANMEANKFDDWLVVFYRLDTQWCVLYFPYTTDPGAYWLKEPMNELGTAILKEGQIRGAFELGMHQNKYPALVQRRPLTVIRDPNRDNILDLDSGIEETGMFGINMHCAGLENVAITVDKWSAGCQVVADWWEYEVLLSLCIASANKFGNSFTYTLLNQRDFGIWPKKST